jgi:hypothetical protein
MLSGLSSWLVLLATAVRNNPDFEHGGFIAVVAGGPVQERDALHVYRRYS